MSNHFLFYTFSSGTTSVILSFNGHFLFYPSFGNFPFSHFLLHPPSVPLLSLLPAPHLIHFYCTDAVLLRDAEEKYLHLGPNVSTRSRCTSVAQGHRQCVWRPLPRSFGTAFQSRWPPTVAVQQPDVVRRRQPSVPCLALAIELVCSAQGDTHTRSRRNEAHDVSRRISAKPRSRQLPKRPAIPKKASRHIYANDPGSSHLARTETPQAQNTQATAGSRLTPPTLVYGTLS